MSTEISTDMVQRPSNPQSATQGEVAKRGSISGRLLQTVPEKGSCSDTKKKRKVKRNVCTVHFLQKLFIFVPAIVPCLWVRSVY